MSDSGNSLEPGDLGPAVVSRDFDLNSDGENVWTEGLSSGGYPDLIARVSDPTLLPAVEGLLRWIADYMTTNEVEIRPKETIAYGYWIVKFEELDSDHFELWEYDETATKYIPGVNITLRYWREQHEICARYDSSFDPPRPDKLVVLSEGVLDGDVVQGVRYPSPLHMSGWWITTDRYSGDVKSLMREHLYHLTAARPDLARFIALPFGYRFNLSQGEEVWFDSEVASAEP